jgi:Fe-S-cluster-containing dehydrogenase component
MGISRRAALKGILTAGSGAAVGTGAAEARVVKAPPPDAVGLLYDATMCVGCKACVVACREANGLPPDTASSGGLYDAPADLNGYTKNVIKLAVDGGERSYMKAQCMHCVDPACASACMLGALNKREHGIVTYDADLCIGCRYCQIACPYGIPKFQWTSATPKIVKCELCRERLAAGREPACAEVCPRKAVIYGTRDALLLEARTRLAQHPDRYVPRIYGEHDGGGTQVLYLSHMPFEKLGLPALGEESVVELPRTIQHGLYKGFVAPVVLYGVLGVVMLRNRKREPAEGEVER